MLLPELRAASTDASVVSLSQTITTTSKSRAEEALISLGAIFVLTHHPEDATPADGVTSLNCDLEL